MTEQIKSFFGAIDAYQAKNSKDQLPAEFKAAMKQVGDAVESWALGLSIAQTETVNSVEICCLQAKGPGKGSESKGLKIRRPMSEGRRRRIS